MTDECAVDNRAAGSRERRPPGLVGDFCSENPVPAAHLRHEGHEGDEASVSPRPQPTESTSTSEGSCIPRSPRGPTPGCREVRSTTAGHRPPWREVARRESDREGRRAVGLHLAAVPAADAVVAGVRSAAAGAVAAATPALVAAVGRCRRVRSRDGATGPAAVVGERTMRGRVGGGDDNDGGGSTRNGELLGGVAPSSTTSAGPSTAAAAPAG